MAPSAGATRFGGGPHSFTKESGVDQPETTPFPSSARTRHQYVPFVRVFVRVARVFFVRKDDCVELNPGSAETWNSYRTAPATPFQAKAGVRSRVSPAGLRGSGTAGALAAGGGSVATAQRVVSDQEKIGRASCRERV